jgi:hypothetical protein
MVPLLASWNESAEELVEAPLDGPITRGAYGGYTRSKYLQRTYTRVQHSSDVGVNGHGD